MEHFKVGDKVKMLSSCSGAKEGEEYYLDRINGTLTTKDNTGEPLCSCTHLWKLVENDRKKTIGKKRITNLDRAKRALDLEKEPKEYQVQMLVSTSLYAIDEEHVRDLIEDPQKKILAKEITVKKIKKITLKK